MGRFVCCTGVPVLVVLASGSCGTSATAPGGTVSDATVASDTAQVSGSLPGGATSSQTNTGAQTPPANASTTSTGAAVDPPPVVTPAGSETGGAPSTASEGAIAGDSSGTTAAGSWPEPPSSGTAGSGDSSGAAAVGAPSEMPGSSCTREFTAPAFSELKANAKLPDPFTFLDGSKVVTREDWACRQKEISTLAQAFIYGPKPPPPESVEATFSNGTLNITVSDKGRSIDFSVKITTPDGPGPHPAVFNIGATIPNTGSIAYQSVGEQLAKSVGSQGRKSPTGLFYELYPDSKDTGSLMAWAWGASRVVDALEKTEGHNVDFTKLTALGCSRNGKEAATIALFDARIAMVATQSPGSATTSGWRVAEAQTSSVQTADQIFGEDTWMGEPFGQFGNQVDKLPIDQHEVLALAWPRPLIVREGTNDSWNCPVCVYSTLKYTQMVFEALGDKDAVGFTHYNGGHCENGGATWSNLQDAFVKKYLFGDASVSTAGMFTESFDFDAAKWQDGELASIPQ